MDLLIYIDGGSRGNPGPAAAGVVISDQDSERTLHEGGYFLGRATNNAAEYHGLIRALELTRGFDARRVHINSDSELIVKQITGEYRVKSPDLMPLYEKAQGLLLALGAWQIQHVPREENHRADQLANIALDRKRDVIISSTLAGVSGVSGGAVASGVSAEGAAVSLAEGTEVSAEPAVILPPDVPLAEPQWAAVAPPTRPQQPRQVSPRWTAEFVDPPADGCPARCAAGTVYRFGPGAPGGMCIHAAAVVFDEGPLVWDDPKQREDITFCPRCRAKIRIQRTDE